jgi:hypothetical protein
MKAIKKKNGHLYEIRMEGKEPYTRIWQVCLTNLQTGALLRLDIGAFNHNFKRI